jgi:hypothetical protein
MKNTKFFTITFLGVLLLTSSLQAQEKSETLQWNCPSPTDITYPDSEKAMWDILFYFETTASSQGGVATDGNFIYTSSFSTEMFRKFTMDGVFVEEFTIPGISNCGCLTYDGNKFYGARGYIDDGIYVMDLENHLLTNTISLSVQSIIGIGHISYDPSLDNGNGGFWIGYWHELAAVDMSGNEIIPNVVTGMPGIAGTALDNVTDPDNPGLFCFQQTGGSDLEITKFDINTQTFSGVLHVATDIPGPSGGSSNSIASGMNSFINNDGKLVLLGMIDCFPGNEMIFEYEITNAFNYTNDISVQSLISPVTGENLTANEDITVKLLNNGTEAQSGFDIQYTIDDGTGPLGPFTKTVTETINPGDFLEVTFDEQADLSSAGTEYTIVVSSFLTGDENPANDILTKVVQNTAGVYCYASGSSSSNQEYISNMTFGDISNSSSASQYTNYSGDPALYIYLEPGVASALTITLANPYNADLSAVWIDWNANGDFSDPGENVFVSAFGQGPYNTDITAPDDALQNTKLRMRIRLDYNNPAPEPCGTTSFGEVEDYAVFVTGAQLNPATNLQYEISGIDINLTWDAPESKDLLGYNVYHSFNLGEFENAGYVTGTSYTFESAEIGSHRFFVTAVYDEGESPESNMVEAVIAAPMPPENLQLEIDEGNFYLSWDAPGGKDLLGYNLYRSLNYGNFVLLEYTTGTSYTIESPEPGGYRFYVTSVYDQGESSASDTIEIMYTGMIENNLNTINIYPNPVTGFATLMYQNPGHKVYNLKIMNIKGETVRTINNITDNKLVIEKGNLTSGIYFIEIRGEKTFRSKFLIN